MQTDLPSPSGEARARSDELLAEIASEIVADGPMRFDDYMQRVLYHPRFGYYSSGQVTFGAGGDFVTAPELSALFGQTLARPVVATLREVGGSVLELGAGSGALAASILPALAEQGVLPDEYLILEASAALAQRQCEQLQRDLPDLVDRVRWLDRWPADFSGAVLANEVLDAMPVARFRVNAEGPSELGLDSRDGALFEVELAPRESLLVALAEIEADLGQVLPLGYESEINLALPGWIAGLSNTLVAGSVLLIDYGYPRREYYAAERDRGTLRMYYQQRAFDEPTCWPGLCDLTAHVDFSAAALAAQDAGLTHEGFAPQAAFLLACGVAVLAETAMADAADDVARLRIAQGVRQLMMPGEMGEAFRVLGLSRGLAQPLPGFAGVDLSARL